MGTTSTASAQVRKRATVVRGGRSLGALNNLGISLWITQHLSTEGGNGSPDGALLGTSCPEVIHKQSTDSVGPNKEEGEGERLHLTPTLPQELTATTRGAWRHLSPSGSGDHWPS